MSGRLTENINKIRDISPKFFVSSTVAPLLVDHIEPHVYMDEWSVQPFNGQVQRIAAICSLAMDLRPTIAVETGTYLGSSTPYLAGLAEKGAVTIEIDDFAADRAEQRFKRNHPSLSIRLMRGDSATLIKEALAPLDAEKDRVLAYLDAHWLDQIPTRAELEALEAWGGVWVAVIDDFLVSSDSGYGYDSYGETVIGPDIVPPKSTLQVWVLKAESHTETGARRGTGIVIPEASGSFLSDSSFRQLRRVR